MKISDVLWEAACNYSNEPIVGTCSEIRYVTASESSTVRAKEYYGKLMSPKNKGSGYYWFGSTYESKNEPIRFFHLLMAYEMAKSDGL